MSKKNPLCACCGNECTDKQTNWRTTPDNCWSLCRECISAGCIGLGNGDLERHHGCPLLANKDPETPLPEAKFAIGDMVNYHSIVAGEKHIEPGMTIHAAKFLRNKPVYWLSGKPGCVAEDTLTPSNLPEARKSHDEDGEEWLRRLADQDDAISLGFKSLIERVIYLESEIVAWRGRVPVALDALEGITSVATEAKAKNTPEFMEYLAEMIEKAKTVWSELKKESS